MTHSQLKDQIELALRQPPPSEEDLENQVLVQLGALPNEAEVEGDAEPSVPLDRAIGALELLYDQL